MPGRAPLKGIADVLSTQWLRPESKSIRADRTDLDEQIVQQLLDDLLVPRVTDQPASPTTSMSAYGGYGGAKKFATPEPRRNALRA